MCKFFTGLLEFEDELGDAFGFCILLQHFHRYVDEVILVEPSTVDNEMLEEVIRRNAVIECNSVTEILVPHFIDDGSNEEGCCFFGGHVGGVAEKFCVVGRFHAAVDDWRGGVVDVGVVCCNAVGPGEGCVPCSSIEGGLLNETDKVVRVHADNPHHVIVQVVE